MDWHYLLAYPCLIIPFIIGYRIGGPIAGRSKKPLWIGIAVIVLLVTAGIWFARPQPNGDVTAVDLPR